MALARTTGIAERTFERSPVPLATRIHERTGAPGPGSPPPIRRTGLVLRVTPRIRQMVSKSSNTASYHSWSRQVSRYHARAPSFAVSGQLLYVRRRWSRRCGAWSACLRACVAKAKAVPPSIRPSPRRASWCSCTRHRSRRRWRRPRRCCAGPSAAHRHPSTPTHRPGRRCRRRCCRWVAAAGRRPAPWRA